MCITRFKDTGPISSIEEKNDGEYCLYLEYYLLKKDYDQLKKDNSLLLDKLHEYRHMIKTLTEK